VPFDKGYYVEFKVKSFSEFWLNNGGIGGSHPLPVELISFTAKKKTNKDVLLEWVTAQELNVDRYEIEVAKGNDEYQRNHFIKIGTVNSLGNSTQEQHYNFTDAENGKSGVRYYRLKMIDVDGSFKYSAVRPVVFNNEITWQVYPNPSTGIFNLILQEENGSSINTTIHDVNGKLVYSTKISATGFVQKLVIDLHEPKYASGIYLIKTEALGKNQFFKLIKQ
jgi:hypothetical protein